MFVLSDNSITIIAEAGVNHNGDLDRALAMVDAAALAGADAVKFQTFRPEALVTADASKAEYQKRNDGGDDSQLQMLRRLALTEQDHRLLLERCKQKCIAFLSTPFDLGSLEFLARTLDMETIKMSSGDLTNGPLLLEVSRLGKPVILSTGMSTLDEVRHALAVLTFGYTAQDEEPSPEAFEQAWLERREILSDKVTLLHCTTEYPCPFEDVNLRAMDTLREAFGLPVGYSDHTPGISVAIAAAARGAVVIEKHFTLDRSLPGPDHLASLEVGELTAMVEAVRQIERALGHGEKQPVAAELANARVARKSLVAARPIRKGELFSGDNLTVKRPGDGLSPMVFWQLLGKTADRDYGQDERVGL